MERLEISDLILHCNVETLERHPVKREDVVNALRNSGQTWAARYVATLPTQEGILDAQAVDGILLRSHTELQRLSEEFLQADRLRLLLQPMLQTLRDQGVPPPYRVVDVGCGLGYVTRALAGHGRLGRDVELLGCDMNRTLIHAAQQLADLESLPCSFRVANAFTLKEPAHLFISTGVVHHFRGAALTSFFGGQTNAFGFIHHDIQPSILSPLGAWLFHLSRMREPLARHDGVVSAQRAHGADALLNAARSVPGFHSAMFDTASSFAGVVLRPMHAVLGVREGLWGALLKRLGPLAKRLGPS